MTKQEFFKRNDAKLLPLGFSQDLEDPQFHYYKSILTDEERKEFLQDFGPEYEPKILIGQTPLNKGICLFTGSNFLWLNVESPEQAIEWAKTITFIEDLF